MANYIKIIVSAIITIAIAVSVSSSQAQMPEWHMVNVNNHTQGDAHVLIDNGVVSMIDAGQPSEAKRYLVPYLKAHNIRVIEHFWVSHPHTDHYGGIESLLDARIQIKNIYYNMPPEDVRDWNYIPFQFMATMNRAKSMGSKLFDVKKGFKVRTKNTTMTVIHAQKTKTVNGQTIDVNDYSLIMQWDAGEFRTLFTGDLNKKLGTKLSQFDFVKADILKMPHHGVTGIAPNSLFDTVAPSMVMFPSTKTLWNHPRGRQAKLWTLNQKINFCSNGLNGNVVLKFGKSVVAHIENATKDCPNGLLLFKPGEKVGISRTVNMSPIYSLLELM